MYLIILIGQTIFIFTNFNIAIDFFTNPDNRIIIGIISYFFVIPTLFLWIYNIRFFYKYDRYSKAILPLIFFNFAYSPYYYYQVKIKGRPLKNEIKKEPVIGNTIHLEEYENESDYKDDLKDLKEKYSG